MKKTRLLIALLVMLVAASGYAQDSYRQAVKDFVTLSGQWENTKSLITTTSLLFDRSGDVDIDQLTKRFIDECLEDTYLDASVSLLKARGITEADLNEVSSLYAKPEIKAFEAHQKAWMVDVATYMMEPLMKMMENASQGIYEDTGMADRIQTVQPNPEIDAAYAEKFNNVMLESPLIKKMEEAMIQRMDQDTPLDDPIAMEAGEDAKNAILKSLPAILLNSAYGNLTLEDLDVAARLYSNEAYCKLQDTSNADEETRILTQNQNYPDWMKEHGAKMSEDPNAMLEYYKAILGKDLEK